MARTTTLRRALGLLSLLFARGAPAPRAIIQTGAPHTGSTLLANIVQGLVDAARPLEHGMYLDASARPTARAVVPGVVFKFHNTSDAFMDAQLRAGRFVFVSRRARHATVDAARYEGHPAVCVPRRAPWPAEQADPCLFDTLALRARGHGRSCDRL